MVERPDGRQFSIFTYEKSWVESRQGSDLSPSMPRREAPFHRTHAGKLLAYRPLWKTALWFLGNDVAPRS
ncbi:HipA N-terminal domain-containing protein [Tepidicaulis sp. LMO-SS28]|uniref:HipA N-terminal domain-containing protein n=1 Tax=Tepidicaulis sp. LMO-SS28 TaxID=3447455 RepID=UPI003EDEE879